MTGTLTPRWRAVGLQGAGRGVGGGCSPGGPSVGEVRYARAVGSSVGEGAPVVVPALARESGSRTSGRRPGKRAVLFGVTVLLAAVFTYLAVRGVNWHKAWRALERCDAWWLVPAMVAFTVQTVLRGMRWRSLFAPGRRPPRRPVMAATMIGYLFNNIMPARAGEAARVVALSQSTTAPAAEIVGTVVVERAYDVLSILIIYLLRLAMAAPRKLVGTAAIFAGVVAVGLAR